MCNISGLDCLAAFLIHSGSEGISLERFLNPWGISDHVLCQSGCNLCQMKDLQKRFPFHSKTWYLVKASWMRTANNSLLILPSCMCHASFHINHLQQLNRKNTLLWCWVRCYFCTCICIGLVKMWMFVFEGIPWPLSIYCMRDMSS